MQGERQASMIHELIFQMKQTELKICKSLVWLITASCYTDWSDWDLGQGIGLVQDIFINSLHFFMLVNMIPLHTVGFILLYLHQSFVPVTASKNILGDAIS